MLCVGVYLATPILTMRRSFLALLLLPLLGGCYPVKPDFINEYDLVFTDHSPSFDFQSQGTYALPDSVVIISDQPDGQPVQKVPPAYGDRILDRLRANMSTLGWQEVDEQDDPDVILLPGAIKTVTVNVYSYPWDYWDWYYPGYYPGWGWDYPGYEPMYSSYTTGSLIVQMTVPDGVSPAQNIPVAWVTVINGLLEGSQASILDRINSNIDQAFTQSPYLAQ